MSSHLYSGTSLRGTRGGRDGGDDSDSAKNSPRRQSRTHPNRTSFDKQPPQQQPPPRASASASAGSSAGRASAPTLTPAHVRAQDADADADAGDADVVGGTSPIGSSSPSPPVGGSTSPLSPRVAKARKATVTVVPSPPPMIQGGNLPLDFIPPGSMDDSDDDSMTSVIVAEHYTKEAAGERLVGLPGMPGNGMNSALGHELGSRVQGYGGGSSENMVNGSTAQQLKMMRGAQGLRQAPSAPGTSTQLTQQPLMTSQQPLRVAPITTLTLDL